MTYWPQLLAAVYVLIGSLAINAIVMGIGAMGKTSPLMQRALPMLPVLIGAALALAQWPFIFELVCTGVADLEKINWASPKMRGFCIVAGIGQGAVSLNMHKFFTQTLLGKDGVIEGTIRKKLQLPPVDRD